jgi:hypothetical protein
MQMDRAVEGGNSGAFLAAVLQRLETENGETSGIRGMHPDHATFIPRFNFPPTPPPLAGEGRLDTQGFRRFVSSR